MAQIIESIPNISEGRNQEVIEACVDQIRTTPGCTLLNYSSDPNHNRTVITYIGDAKGVEEASVKLAKKAVELIKRNIIKQHNHALRRQLEIVRGLHHGQAGVVHKGLRLEQNQLFSLKIRLCVQTAEFCAVDLHAEALCQQIDRPEADIVACSGIIVAGIAETDDQPIAGGLTQQHQNRLEMDVSL